MMRVSRTTNGRQPMAHLLSRPTSSLALFGASCAALAVVAAPGCDDDIDTEKPPPTTTGTTTTTGTAGNGGGGGSGGATGGGGSTQGGGGSAPVCGDGVVEGDEECDDKNTTPGDGCDENCKKEDPCKNPMPTVVMSTGTNTCPGDKLTLDYDATLPCTLLQVKGNTANATNGHQSICGQSDGKDHVYEVTVAKPGSLRIVLKSEDVANYNPTLYRRHEGKCADDTDFFGCYIFSPKLEGFAQHWDPATDGKSFYVFVDGANLSSGPYTLEVFLREGVCGDGIKNANEECDDGNTKEYDGCSPTCKFETNAIFDDCSGYLVKLKPNQPQVLEGNTTQFKHDYKPYYDGTAQSCSYDPEFDGFPIPAGAGKDTVYHLIPEANGTVTAKIGYDLSGNIDVCAESGTFHPQCWDRLLYVVGPGTATDPIPLEAECNALFAAKKFPLACSDKGAFTPEVISFPVEATKNYFLAVDSYHDDPNGFGSFIVHVELKP
jgi:cysteine-rich repeat protein